jgi:hypothetical protein
MIGEVADTGSSIYMFTESTTSILPEFRHHMFLRDMFKHCHLFHSSSLVNGNAIPNN